YRNFKKKGVNLMLSLTNIQELESESDINLQNEDNYERLLVSVESNYHRLNLLIAVSDTIIYRTEIINRYEKELDVNIRKYQAVLTPEKPSLKETLLNLAEIHPELKSLDSDQQVIVTITGAEKLNPLSINNENNKSEQDEFFGYLQWQREALREFPYSIILWVTPAIIKQLPLKAADFWSWRNGVFRFQNPAYLLQENNELYLNKVLHNLSCYYSAKDAYLPPLDYFYVLRDNMENEKGQEDISLINIYEGIGDNYWYRISLNKVEDYPQEIKLGIEYLEKTINLRQKFNKEYGLEKNLNHLADIYYYQGDYNTAETFKKQAVTLSQKLYGENHLQIAISLNNLANIYFHQGKYAEAEDTFINSLDMMKEILGDEHPDITFSLNGLINVYQQQGKYEEAENLRFQVINIMQKVQEQNYMYAIYYLNNLANFYKQQKRYEKAELLYIEAMNILIKTLGENHDYTILVKNNFIDLIKRVISDQQESILSNDSLTQSLIEQSKS
ncbi:MAG TPA: tetratricopeptide repeat protein, partial [Allocoleopsis sp.]